MIAAVGGGGDGKGGGVFAPTGGSPVGVSDQLLGAPGTPGFPAPQTGAAKEARNNRGSNEKVPYARLVPVQSSTDMAGAKITTLAPLPASHGIEAQARAHAIKNEYTDLKSGELAWVRGNYVRDIDKKTVRPPGILDFGMGPDRFQRLASTSWVERFFYYVHGKDRIKLNELRIADTRFQRGMPLEAPEIVEFVDYLADSVATHVSDVPFVLAERAAAGGALTPTAKAQAVSLNVPMYPEAQVDADGNITGYTNVPTGSNQFKCGINTTTTSAFLHGFMMDDSFVKVGRVSTKETAVYTVADEPPGAFYEFARNFGDNMAFTALYTHLRSKGFFSWSPDGLTLSKLASPSGDQMATDELDTRSGQLFNVAVAGNSIATTWTGDPAMPAMPGDSVYMLLIAEVVTKTSAGGAAARKRDKDTKAAEAALAEAVEAAKELAPGAARQRIRAAKQALEVAKAAVFGESDADGPATDAAVQEHLDAVDAYVSEVMAGKQGEAVDATRNETTKNYIDNSKPGAMAQYEAIAKLSQRVRANKAKVDECVMTNFRWRRSTSSYLANHSAIKPQSEHSRCGLGLGSNDAANPSVVTGQYIVGAWRIGTVLDNAASRAGAPSMGVRTAPSSYAISVNVNVQWVSSDALFRKYDGRHIGLVGRGEVAPERRDALQFANEVMSAPP